MNGFIQAVFILNLVYHPTSRQELCMELYDNIYYCQDQREIFVGCTYEYNIAICPELIGV